MPDQPLSSRVTVLVVVQIGFTTLAGHAQDTAAPWSDGAAPDTVETGRLIFHQLLRPVGEETYSLSFADDRYTLSARFIHDDRGKRTEHDMEMRFRSDLTTESVSLRRGDRFEPVVTLTESGLATIQDGVSDGARSFAEYNLRPNMAATPEAVWSFLDDLAERTTEKARLDLDQLLEVQRTAIDGPVGTSVQPWNTGYLRNTILKRDFNVDAEQIREYLPMESALAGMMELYQHLLGLEFRKVENPSVWHHEVEAYEVFEAGALVGRFYLDLFPRPNKESWFYGVPLTPGKMHADGYEVPVAMLLGNFTRPTEDLPSLMTHDELRILFHEFGHIVNSMSYRGEFAMQSGSRPDFGEAMSQIFENWIWDYDVLKTFARHYETDEVLPKELFDNMLAARNVASGLDAQRQVRRAVYDMMLYDRFDPADPLDTDRLWTQIADRFVVDSNVDGTHPQASWIHINTHPTYYYGYLWSAVYAADMFTQFEANGLWDTETGVRYRETILANGTQRPIDEAVEAFLGRPMSSEAYIRSLGLDPGR